MRVVRVVAAPAIAAVLGLAIVLAVELAFVWAHGSEYQAAPDRWTAFFWADHYIWRVVASVFSASLCGACAGVIARKFGVAVGIAAVAPSTFAWIVVAHLAWTGKLPFDWLPGKHFRVQPGAHRWQAIACIVANLVGGGIGGHVGSQVSSSLRQPPGLYLVGIRPQHWLYLVPLCWVSLIVFAFGAVRTAYWLPHIWELQSKPLFPTAFLGFLVAMVFIFLHAYGAVLPWIGLRHAFAALRPEGPRDGWKKAVLLGAIGGPVGGMAMQAAGAAAHVGIAKLLG